MPVFGCAIFQGFGASGRHEKGVYFFRSDLISPDGRLHHSSECLTTPLSVCGIVAMEILRCPDLRVKCGVLDDFRFWTRPSINWRLFSLHFFDLRFETFPALRSDLFRPETDDAAFTRPWNPSYPLSTSSIPRFRILFPEVRTSTCSHA